MSFFERWLEDDKFDMFVAEEIWFTAARTPHGGMFNVHWHCLLFNVHRYESSSGPKWSSIPIGSIHMSSITSPHVVRGYCIVSFCQSQSSSFFLNFRVFASSFCLKKPKRTVILILTNIKVHWNTSRSRSVMVRKGDGGFSLVLSES